MHGDESFSLQAAKRFADRDMAYAHLIGQHGSGEPLSRGEEASDDGGADLFRDLID
jgi:hypothetical protein